MPAVTGRIPYAIGRFFGQPGPGNPDQLDATMFPVVEVDSARPERAFIQGERLFQAAADVTAGGANFGAVYLTLAATANVLVIVEYIRVQLVAVAGSINFFLGTTIVGSPGGTVARDLRILPAGLSSSQAVFGTNVGATNPAAGNFMGWNLAVAETQLFTVPLIMAPVVNSITGLSIVTGTVTTRMFVSIAWRERPLAIGELQI